MIKLPIKYGLLDTKLRDLIDSRDPLINPVPPLRVLRREVANLQRKIAVPLASVGARPRP